ncbi:MAG: TraR/DksA family transcriptional regulator [Minisyncoccota bacterium]
MNTEHFKEALEKEQAVLENELKSVGRQNTQAPGGWEPTPAPIDILRADPSEVAEGIEEFEGRAAIETELENRLLSVQAALDRIANGTYGLCRVCGEPIENDRLEANPAADTCKAHLNT